MNWNSSGERKHFLDLVVSLESTGFALRTECVISFKEKPKSFSY